MCLSSIHPHIHTCTHTRPVDFEVCARICRIQCSPSSLPRHSRPSTPPRHPHRGPIQSQHGHPRHAGPPGGCSKTPYGAETPRHSCDPLHKSISSAFNSSSPPRLFALRPRSPFVFPVVRPKKILLLDDDDGKERGQEQHDDDKKRTLIGGGGRGGEGAFKEAAIKGII